MFLSFSNVQIVVFTFTIKWNNISFSIHQKLFWMFSAIIMEDQQFKYTSHCLCIFYPEPFHFFAPTLHIIEWKALEKSLFLFNYSLNLKTFRALNLEETLELMTLPKTVVLFAKYYPCSQSFSSTVI